MFADFSLSLPKHVGAFENAPFAKQFMVSSPSCKNPSLQLTVNSVPYINLPISDY